MGCSNYGPFQLFLQLAGKWAMNEDVDFLFAIMISELAIFTKGCVGWSIILLR